MEQEQLLRLKMPFLLRYNLGIVFQWGELTFGGGENKNLVGGRGGGSLLGGRFFQVGRNEQIFSWWRGDSHPHPPSRENLADRVRCTRRSSYINLFKAGKQLILVCSMLGEYSSKLQLQKILRNIINGQRNSVNLKMY